MRNSPYFIAFLLVILWGIITFGFKEVWFANILLPLAFLIVLIRFFYARNESE